MNEVEAVPDLYRLAYMPGQFRCSKCGFQWSIQTVNVARGEIGTTEENRQTPDCPNDGTRMVCVTYKEQLEAYAGRLNEELDNVDHLREFKKSVDKAVTVAFLGMTDQFGPPVDPRTAVEHIREEFRDAEMKFQRHTRTETRSRHRGKISRRRWLLRERRTGESMKINRDRCELVCEIRGGLVPVMVIGYGRHICGNIADGINIAMGEGSAGFVFKFADLETAYVEAKNFRERNPPTEEEKKLAAMLERRRAAAKKAIR